MKYIKTIKRIGVYLIVLGLIIFVASLWELGYIIDSFAVLAVITGPGIWLVVIASKMRKSS